MREKDPHSTDMDSFLTKSQIFLAQVATSNRKNKITKYNGSEEHWKLARWDREQSAFYTSNSKLGINTIQLDGN